jgi:hypothetical protein
VKNLLVKELSLQSNFLTLFKMKTERILKSIARDNYIAGIYNYCDSWCARCRFDRQCKIESEEFNKMMFDEYIDEELHHKIDLISENLNILLGKLIDNSSLNETVPAQLTGHRFDEEDAGDVEHELLTACDKYISLVTDFQLKWPKQEFFQEEEFPDFLSVPNFEIEDDDYHQEDIAAYYAPLIRTRLASAIYILQSGKEMYDVNNFQLNYNGFAKSALVALDISKCTWEKILNENPDTVDEIISIFIILESMRKDIVNLFADAEKFIRPGFDS